MKRLLLVAALSLGACGPAPEPPSGNLSQAEEEARYQAIANELAWEERMRAEVMRNAALAAEADNAMLALQDEMVLNAAPVVPLPDDATIDDTSLPAYARKATPAELQTAEDAVRNAMERRRAER